MASQTDEGIELAFWTPDGPRRSTVDAFTIDFEPSRASLTLIRDPRAATNTATAVCTATSAAAASASTNPPIAPILDSTESLNSTTEPLLASAGTSTTGSSIVSAAPSGSSKKCWKMLGRTMTVGSFVATMIVLVFTYLMYKLAQFMARLAFKDDCRADREEGHTLSEACERILDSPLDPPGSIARRWNMVACDSANPPSSLGLTYHLSLETIGIALLLLVVVVYGCAWALQRFAVGSNLTGNAVSSLQSDGSEGCSMIDSLLNDRMLAEVDAWVRKIEVTVAAVSKQATEAGMLDDSSKIRLSRMQKIKLKVGITGRIKQLDTDHRRDRCLFQQPDPAECRRLSRLPILNEHVSWVLQSGSDAYVRNGCTAAVLDLIKTLQLPRSNRCVNHCYYLSESDGDLKAYGIVDGVMYSELVYDLFHCKGLPSLEPRSLGEGGCIQGCTEHLWHQLSPTIVPTFETIEVPGVKDELRRVMKPLVEIGHLVDQERARPRRRQPFPKQETRESL